jgi:hypothetical protein
MHFPCVLCTVSKDSDFCFGTPQASSPLESFVHYSLLFSFFFFFFYFTFERPKKKNTHTHGKHVVTGWVFMKALISHEHE